MGKQKQPLNVPMKKAALPHNSGTDSAQADKFKLSRQFPNLTSTQLDIPSPCNPHTIASAHKP